MFLNPGAVSRALETHKPLDCQRSYVFYYDMIKYIVELM